MRETIEAHLYNAVTGGQIPDGGFCLSYRNELATIISEALKGYKRENPRDLVQYLGWNGERYVIQIVPSPERWTSIQSQVLNLSLERVSPTSSAVSD
jgi:hypothetical protein